MLQQINVVICGQIGLFSLWCGYFRWTLLESIDDANLSICRIDYREQANKNIPIFFQYTFFVCWVAGQAGPKKRHLVAWYGCNYGNAVVVVAIICQKPAGAYWTRRYMYTVYVWNEVSETNETNEAIAIAYTYVIDWSEWRKNVNYFYLARYSKWCVLRSWSLIKHNYHLPLPLSVRAIFNWLLYITIATALLKICLASAVCGVVVVVVAEFFFFISFFQPMVIGNGNYFTHAENERWFATAIRRW